MLVRIISEERKLQYWNHFTNEAQKRFRPKKITDLRLNQMKDTFLQDAFFWQDVIIPHDAIDKTPDELKVFSDFNYQQIRSKFWAMVRKKIDRQSTKSTG